MNGIEEAQEVMKEVLKSYHLNEVGSKICSIVYLSPKPICLDTLAHTTGYSLATISNTVKYLADFSLLTKVKKPGTKKVFVAGERKPLDIMELKVNTIIQSEIKPINEKFPIIIKKLQGKKKYESQVKLLKQQYEDNLKFEKAIKQIKTIIENGK